MNEEFYFKEISEDRDNERLDRFLRRTYPSVRLSAIQSFIRSGKIIVNGKRIKDGALRLTVGQHVLIKLRGDVNEILRTYGRSAPEHVPLNIELDLLYEDDEIVAFNKPVGLSVQPGSKISNKSLYNALLGQMDEFFLVHRLDKYTSGVIIVAKTHESAQKLSELFSSHNITKKYLTLVKGLVKNPIDIKEPLDEKTAFTHINPIDFFTGYTLLEVEIFTGRKHQIRRHLAMKGMPVIGDDLYGDDEENEFFRKKYGLKGYFLHCSEISFVHPTKQTKVTIKASMEKSREEILKKLRGV